MGVPYVGSHGVKRHFSNKSGGIGSLSGLDRYIGDSDTTDHLALSFEIPTNSGGYRLGNILKSWFVAPATTNYRFYVACDDTCELRMGDTPMQVEDTTLIASSAHATGHRDWWESSNRGANQRISEWISLEEGEHYYLEARQI